MYAPIILFVYKRYEHTKQTLEALKKNELVSDSILYIFSDGAKSEKDVEDVNNVRTLVSDFAQSGTFKNVELRFSETNKGLAPSVIDGVTEIINQYGKAIVLEDDLITSTDFLKYMNAALDFYENNHTIWSISGYSFFDPETLNYPHDVYMGYRGCSWGWATWKDRWNTVDWDVKDYPQFKINPFLRKKFAVSGNDLPEMLDLQMQGFISSWAVRWCYQQNKTKQYTVFPKFSRIKNIGTDGSGTHSGNNHQFDVTLNTNSTCTFEHLDTDPHILRLYRSKFDRSLWTCAKAYFKHIVLRRK